MTFTILSTSSVWILWAIGITLFMASLDKVIFAQFLAWDFYLLKNHLPRENIQARSITNVYLSETAREVADALGIVYWEGHEKVILPEVKADMDNVNDDMPEEIGWDEIPIYPPRLPEDI